MSMIKSIFNEIKTALENLDFIEESNNAYNNFYDKSDGSDHGTTDNNNNERNSIDNSDQMPEIYQNDTDKPLAYNFSKNLIQSSNIRFSEIESDTPDRKCSFLDHQYSDYLFPDEKTKEVIKKEIKDGIIAYRLPNEVYQVESESISESAGVKPTKFWGFMK